VHLMQRGVCHVESIIRRQVGTVAGDPLPDLVRWPKIKYKG
jgi:hypothetical protein